MSDPSDEPSVIVNLGARPEILTDADDTPPLGLQTYGPRVEGDRAFLEGKIARLTATNEQLGERVAVLERGRRRWLIAIVASTAIAAASLTVQLYRAGVKAQAEVAAIAKCK